MITNTLVLYLEILLIVLDIALVVTAMIIGGKKGIAILIANSILMLITVLTPIMFTPTTVVSYLDGKEYTAVEAYLNEAKLAVNNNYLVVLEDGQNVIADEMVYGETNSYIQGCTLIQNSRSGLKIKSKDKNLLVIKPAQEENKETQAKNN